MDDALTCRRGCVAASDPSPAPKVFWQADGFEFPLVSIQAATKAQKQTIYELSRGLQYAAYTNT